MEWLAEKLTDLLRPWHDDGLPEELAFGEIEAWNFVRLLMRRNAQLSVSLNLKLGVFGIIGLKYARRAARAWWPTERLLMEDVSCAFQPIQARAGSGHPTPQLLIDRLVFLLARYLAYVGSPRPEEQLREAVARFLRDYPRDVPEGATEGTEQETAPAPAH